MNFNKCIPLCNSSPYLDTDCSHQLRVASCFSHVIAIFERTALYPLMSLYTPQLKIPVSGPKSEGHLYVSSSRDAPFKRYDGKVGGEQEENLLLETILISLFNCSCMIAALRISFTKLQKFHSQDNTHAHAFALSSVRTFSPVLTTGSEEL